MNTVNKQPKILIVDDKSENLLSLEEVLAGTEADIIRAANGNDALRATLTHEFAVALLDVQMPDMDGYELAEYIRGVKETQHLPIIFISAVYSEDFHVFKGYEAGAVDYLIKPFNPKLLINKVKVFLQLHRQKKDLAERTRELSDINRELETFAYSVSHDLRAPLRVIKSFSQALIEDYHDKLDDHGKDYLQRMGRATRRMGQLIDDMLKLSQVMRSEMKCRSVGLGNLAKNILTDLQAEDPQRQVAFAVPENLMVDGDERLLRVALENLIGNAWKFTKNKFPATIEIGVAEQKGEPVYFIRDNGAGFDMAYVDKLFGVFQRLHSEQEFPGTGIGLATVQRIIHRHGGRVWATGEVHKGATFYFSLWNSKEVGE